jgi:hypothetical protein
MASVAAIRAGSSMRKCGSRSIPTDTKNSTANASRIGIASAAARRLNSERPTTMPARNAPRASDIPKATADQAAMLSAVARIVSVNSSRDRVAAMRSSTQGINRPPTTSVKTASAATFSAASPRLIPDVRRLRGGAGEERRQQDEHQHGEQVLDDEPADGDVAGRCVQIVAVGKHPYQDDRAGDRQREAEHDPRGPVPAERVRDAGAQAGRDEALCDGSRNGDPLHGQQLRQVKLEADAEHQQDDADLRELLGERRVGREAGRVRPDDDAGEQVADDRRQPQPV